eukprot:14272373-Heterocapsa_arctica.AAC.1
MTKKEMINNLKISMSSVPTVPIEQINLQENMDYMKKGQYDICYIAGENIKCPHCPSCDSAA